MTRRNDRRVADGADAVRRRPLLRHVRTRVRSPQTNGVVERFFGTLKCERLYRAIIGDGNAFAVEINQFRHTYNTLRRHQALDDRTPRQAYLTSRESQ
ncbi:integrase core domain-containing protein [Streptomyces sp. NPDC048825]|uniref:integrase core domain-containing protein n=1 Tax=Streptomyces sp. NPDC048825 TaxID=3365592 RepID=UPI00371020B7